MGEVPEWYPLFRAARYLGVSPWSLAKRPKMWMYWAGIAEAAEIEAQQTRK